MDPKLVVQRPPDNVLTPLQRKAFDIRDRYIEQNVPCYVTYGHTSPNTSPGIKGQTADDVSPAKIYIRNNFGYVSLEGWQDPDGEVRATVVPFVKQDVRLELQRQEEAFLGQAVEAGETLPLRDEDLRAIGISKKEEEVNANDEFAKDQGSGSSSDTGNQLKDLRSKR